MISENKLEFIHTTLQNIYGLWWLKSEYMDMIQESIEYVEEIKKNIQQSEDKEKII